MKKANNNEMDLVLRGLAKSRRDDPFLDNGSASRHNSGESDTHLDADELNSFSEGLVPESARARYVEHLADCSNCRRLVLSLTQASGNLSVSPVADKQSGPGFWHRMTAMFSPQVLRYAAPALVLTAVIAIGLMAWRQQRSQDFVAQQTPTEKVGTHSTQPPATAEPTTTSGNETRLAPRTAADSSRADSTRESNNPQPVQGEVTKSQTDTGMLAAAPASADEVSAPTPPAVAPGVSRTKPFFSPEPKAGTSDAAPTVLSDKKTEASKEEQPVDRMVLQRERDEATSKRGNENEYQIAAPKVGAASGPRRAEALMTENRARGAKNKKDSDSHEMRSVSGKRFRREGNVWVDSSYESARATINVTRGSEQFRALVADEPEIRAIANQLGGEVIVVWKGKAYRIR